MLSWDNVKVHFFRDGGLRDILVPESDADDWEALISVLKQGRWSATFKKDGLPANLPGKSEIESGCARYFARIGVLPRGLNCHFLTDGDVELDFEPEDIGSQSDLNALIEFCNELASYIGKPVVVTYENDPERVILQFPCNDKHSLG